VQPFEPLDSEVGRQSTRRIVVVGAAGGVGTSLVAGGLALGLADAGEPVRLLDLAGDLAGAWGVPPDRTIDDLLPVIDELERRHVEIVALRHPSNVTLILGPPAGGPDSRWDRPAVIRLLDCAGAVDALVVDAGTGVGVPAEAACGRGRLVVVTAQTLAGARSARARIARVGSVGQMGEPIVVANRGVGRDHLNTRTFARALGHPVAVELGRVDREADALGSGRWPAGRRRSLVGAMAALVHMVRVA
jgi:Flp pilus assembly CpaE family ATPase